MCSLARSESLQAAPHPIGSADPYGKHRLPVAALIFEYNHTTPPKHVLLVLEVHSLHLPCFPFGIEQFLVVALARVFFWQ